MRKIGIVGAGAVGGNLAVRLANAGNEVTVIARGANAQAISERGLILKTPSATLSALSVAAHPATARPELAVALLGERYEVMRTAIKKVRAALDAGKPEDAAAALKAAQPVIDSMVNKGIIHKNAAARYKSRLAAGAKKAAAAK